MDRKYYLDLAASGLRMPIGADLVLREKPDAEEITLDGRRLGNVVEEAARRFHTPLAIPLMDLMVEKAALMEALGIPSAEAATYHFSSCPTDAHIAAVEGWLKGPLTARMRANAEAVAYIARETDMVPSGMCIGPFSLMTKLVADPIAPVYLAGTGVTADEDVEVRIVERAMELGMKVILRSIEMQIEAGARLIVIAEPAANRVYLSPKQLEKGSDIFERYVMVNLRRVRALLADRGVDLFFHDCGELTDSMVSAFGTLDASVISLGSSRVLWQDAALLPKSTVLYGNLPSKQFYSDDLINVCQVRERAKELLCRMRDARHPFILGSECDVLSVPGAHDRIVSKVNAFVNVK